MQLRGTISHRGIDIGHRIHGVEVHFNQIEGITGLLTSFGNDHGHNITGMTIDAAHHGRLCCLFDR